MTHSCWSFPAADMSVNASAASSGFLFTDHLPFGMTCLMKTPFSFIFTASTCINILILLPVCGVVLHHALRQRSSSPASHSDSYTCHVIAMEIVYLFGCSLSSCGIYSMQLELLGAGIHLFAITWFGKAFFHVLSCSDRYLAVVHPVTYLGLRKERWIRVRNLIICGIWLLCIGGSVLISWERIAIIFMFCLLVASLVLISFCCVSVLCALTHPGPGQQGRDQSKQKAFYTILVILGLLFSRCAGNLVWAVFYVLNVDVNPCVFFVCEVCVNIPSSLVLPLLFLQKAGILVCCK